MIRVSKKEYVKSTHIVVKIDWFASPWDINSVDFLKVTIVSTIKLLAMIVHKKLLEK